MFAHSQTMEKHITNNFSYWRNKLIVSDGSQNIVWYCMDKTNVFIYFPSEFPDNATENHFKRQGGG